MSVAEEDILRFCQTREAIKDSMKGTREERSGEVRRAEDHRQPAHRQHGEAQGAARAGGRQVRSVPPPFAAHPADPVQGGGADRW